MTRCCNETHFATIQRDGAQVETSGYPRGLVTLTFASGVHQLPCDRPDCRVTLKTGLAGQAHHLEFALVSVWCLFCSAQWWQCCLVWCPYRLYCLTFCTQQVQPILTALFDLLQIYTICWLCTHNASGCKFVLACRRFAVAAFLQVIHRADCQFVSDK